MRSVPADPRSWAHATTRSSNSRPRASRRTGRPIEKGGEFIAKGIYLHAAEQTTPGARAGHGQTSMREISDLEGLVGGDECAGVERSEQRVAMGLERLTELLRQLGSLRSRQLDWIHVFAVLGDAETDVWAR